MKWFDPQRSVGRVVLDGKGLGPVACRSAVQGRGERALHAGEPVESDLTVDAADVCAGNICRLRFL
ncbi:cold-shock protein [Streptomyces sp. NPDC088560]|uniref:cold-shock protein n=1 Tax=Streptomyces sp. NPDC088560 TaxID=3365868 RepID=UPI00380EEACC